MNNRMDGILPRTLLIHRQYRELAQAFFDEQIPVMLLKGIALIESCPALMHSRDMEDMDIMVRPDHLNAARALLMRRGYRPAPEDPAAYQQAGQPVAIDLIDRLWYLTQSENAALWDTALLLPEGSRILSPLEFYLHVFAHGAIHHANTTAGWRADIAAIDGQWKVRELPALRARLRMLGWEELHDHLLSGGAPHGVRTRLVLRCATPKAGHFVRVLMLRPRLLVSTIWKLFFPDAAFVRGRYNAETSWQVFWLRLLRPCMLGIEAVRTAASLLIVNSFPLRRRAGPR